MDWVGMQGRSRAVRQERRRVCMVVWGAEMETVGLVVMEIVGAAVATAAVRNLPRKPSSITAKHVTLPIK